MDVIRQQAKAVRLEFEPDIAQLVVREGRIEVLLQLGADLLDVEPADEREAELRGFLDGFEERELVECVGFDAEFPP